METKECCENCRFYREKDKYSECHRGPPSCATAYADFPSVMPANWCGEYESAVRSKPHPCVTCHNLSIMENGDVMCNAAFQQKNFACRNVSLLNGQ